MNKRKKTTFKAFALVLAFIILSTAYLAFLNTGLEFTEDKGTSKIFIANNSLHKIKGIIVSQSTGNGEEKILEADELMPKERIEVPVKGEGRIELTAKAEYHLPVQSTFYSGSSFPGISYELQIEEPVINGVNFNAVLEVCAKEKSIQMLAVLIETEEEFIQTEEKQLESAIGRNRCKEFEFTLKPLKQGETSISFRLTAENKTQEIRKNIGIK